MAAGSHILPLRLRAFLRHPRVRPYVIASFWSLTIFYFVFGALILFTRWYLLPQVDRFKDDIAAYLSQATSAQVTIDAIRPSWESFWPRLELTGVKLAKADDRHATPEVLQVGRLCASFYWRSFLGTPAFRRLTISDADLAVRLTKENTWEVGGVTISAHSAPAGDARGNPVIEWLLHQGLLEVEKTRVRLIDLTYDTPEEVVFSDVTAVFEKGLTDWKFGLQAVQNSDTENPIDIRARFATSLFEPSSDWRTWSGDAYACLTHFDFADLLDGTAAGQFLKKGRGHAEVWASFANGRITSVTADVGLTEAAVQFAKNLSPLEMNHVETRFSMKYGETLHLAAQGLSYNNHFGEHFGPVNVDSVIKLNAEGSDTEHVSITVSALDLEPLLQMIPQAPVPRPVADLVVKHKPQGRLTKTTIGWTGSMASPEDWSVATDFEKLTVATGLSPREKRHDPSAVGFGFANLTGRAVFTKNEGTVTIDSPGARFTAEGIFRHPTIESDRLTGVIRWTGEKTAPDGSTSPLTVTFENVHIANHDAEAEVSGTWKAVGPAGTADLKGRILRAEANRVWRYMPDVVGNDVIDWLEAGLPHGRATEGAFEIRGDFMKFPWSDAKDNGRFFITAKLADAAVDYIPSYRRKRRGGFVPGEWPILDNIRGRITFEGASMTVEADAARTRGVAIASAHAVIPELSSPDVTLIVDGRAQDDLQRMFDYVAASPVRGYVQNAFDGTTAKGAAGLKLHLEIPLLHARDTKVAGSVTLSENAVAMAHPVPPLTEVWGTVNFSEKGADAKRVTAKAWGRDVSAHLATTRDGTLSFTLSGRAAPENIPYFADVALLKEALTHFSGDTAFVGTVNIMPGRGVSVTVQSNLEGVASDLPAPLAKKAAERWPAAFALTPISGRGGAGHRLTLNVGRTKFDSVIELPSEGSKRTALGSFAVGKRTDLPRSGFALEIAGPHLVADPWHPIVERLIDVAKASSSGTENGASATLERVTLDTENLTASGLDLKKLRARAEMTGPDAWRIRLTGDAVDGTVTWNTAGQGAIRALLTKLALPERSSDTLKSALAHPPEGLLPSIYLKADDFRFGKMHFGATELSAANRATDLGRCWSIEALTIKNPGGTLTGTGDWQEESGRHKTHLSAALQMDNAGRLLAELGKPQALADGNGTAAAELSWEGSPWSPVVSSLSGTIHTEMKNGALKQVDTGVGGAVLSLLSMQSLVKRLTLDFSDLTRGGFAFDTLQVDSKLEHGVLSTDNGRIIGPHASVLLSGSADFNTETLDSRVVVLPDINAAGASLAVAIVNPIIGVSTFIAQMLMREPLARLFSTEYTVKGPFDNPVFAKKTAERKADDENAP